MPFVGYNGNEPVARRRRLQHLDTIGKEAIVAEERQSVPRCRVASQAGSDLLLDCSGFVTTKACYRCQSRKDRPTDRSNVVLCPLCVCGMFPPLFSDRIVVQLLIHLVHPRKHGMITSPGSSPLPLSAITRRPQRYVQLRQASADQAHRRLAVILAHFDSGEIQRQAVRCRWGHERRGRAKTPRRERAKYSEPPADEQAEHVYFLPSCSRPENSVFDTASNKPCGFRLSVTPAFCSLSRFSCAMSLTILPPTKNSLAQ